MRTMRLLIPIRRSGSHGVYNVRHGVKWLLKAGWTMLGEGRTECHLRPPSLPAQSEVEVTIPDDSEINAVRDTVHAGCAAWRGAVGLWPASYEPSKPEIICIGGIDRLFSRPAKFTVGSRHLCWLLTYIWEGGDAVPPVRSEFAWHEQRKEG